MFTTSIDKRTVIATTAIITGISAAIISYWIFSNFFQSLLINSAVFFIGFGIGIFIINLYFEANKQKQITYTAFLTIELTFHNARREVLSRIFKKYDLKEFLAVRKSYMEGKGSYVCLTTKDRDLIYEIVKDNYDDLRKLFDHQSKAVKEAASMIILGGSVISDDLVYELLYFQRDTNYFIQIDIANENLQEQVVQIFLNCVISSHIIHRKFIQSNNEDFPEETFGWDLPELPMIIGNQSITHKTVL